jgi:ferredoxin-thioredoxin reductase catalytic subunit
MNHFVRHMLDRDTVHTEFQCTAPEGAPCRTACKTCWNEQREACMCESLEREPDMGDVGHCHILVWLQEDAPDECFNGEYQPVRGPSWQPITPEWTGDHYEWDYA